MNRFIVSIIICLFVVIGSATAQTSTNRPASWAQPMTLAGVPNFYQVTPNLYRGAQPTADGMKKLQALGVRFIVSLRLLRSDEHAVYGTGLKRLSLGMTPFHASTD